MTTVIKVENLSKQYRIGVKEGYRTFRETLVDAAKAPFLRAQEAWRMAHRALSKSINSKPPAFSSPLSTPGSTLSSTDDTIWALKDVSFEVEGGEVVGIIGRNGAGKSTLLKILSKITEPTEGRVELKGRVGSLLEVGTGFHPELTGHENVYLYGAILGMDRWEVTRKFDEIVAFAELEKFIETPVKRYSSGMYMRLAFAVAAHLEPEILLVDEVLAVGDIAFQKKCLGKIEEVSREGRTVLFVSHNMTAVANLCNHCILLDEGQIHSAGIPKDIINRYLSESQQDGYKEFPGEYNLVTRKNPYLQDQILLRKVHLLNSRGVPQDTFQMGQEMFIVIDVEGMSDYHNAWIGVIFKSRDDQRLSGISTGMTCSHVEYPRQKKESAILRIPQIPFTPGSYWIAISVTRGKFGRIDYVDHAAQFFVAEADIYGTGYQVSADYGVIYLDATWEIRGSYIQNESF